MMLMEKEYFVFDLKWTWQNLRNNNVYHFL